MITLPEAVESVYIGGGVWLRVKVLTVGDAVKDLDALRAGVSIAASVAEPDPPEGEVPAVAAGMPIAMFARASSVMAGVCKAAVTAIAQAPEDEAPTGAAWQKCRIVINPEDEDRAGLLPRYCIATLDQVAPGWVLIAGNVALRAAMGAAAELRPLDSSVRPSSPSTTKAPPTAPPRRSSSGSRSARGKRS